MRRRSDRDSRIHGTNTYKSLVPSLWPWIRNCDIIHRLYLYSCLLCCHRCHRLLYRLVNISKDEITPPSYSTPSVSKPSFSSSRIKDTTPDNSSVSKPAINKPSADVGPIESEVEESPATKEEDDLEIPAFIRKKMM